MTGKMWTYFYDGGESAPNVPEPAKFSEVWLANEEGWSIVTQPDIDEESIRLCDNWHRQNPDLPMQVCDHLTKEPIYVAYSNRLREDQVNLSFQRIPGAIRR